MESRKNNDGKGISIVLVGILTIVVAIAGASFAFFQVTVTSDANKIKGESAFTSTALEVTITQKLPETANNTKKLIPQLGTYINSAVSTTNKCVDGNGNLVCRVYEVKVTNKTTTPYYITGTMNLTAPNTMPNLKWSKSTTANSGFTAAGYTKAVTNVLDPSKGATASTTLLSASGSHTFYLVFWIQETGSAQTDTGTFTASLTFNGYSSSTVSNATQGVTSTIRS